MQQAMSRVMLLSISFFSIFSHSYIYSASTSEGYKLMPPLFYAATCGVIVDKKTLDKYKDCRNKNYLLDALSADINAIMDGKYGECKKRDKNIKALKYETHYLGEGKEIKYLLVKDTSQQLHIALLAKNASKIKRKEANKIYNSIKDMEWKYNYGKRMTSLVGFGQGGEFVSKLALNKKEHFRDTQVITIEAEDVTCGSNQEHWCYTPGFGNRNSLNRHTQLVFKHKNPFMLVRNHKLATLLTGLKGENWNFIDMCAKNSGL